MFAFHNKLLKNLGQQMKQSGKTSFSLDTNRIILRDVITLSFSAAKTKF